ncbi:MAG: NAD+ synthase [Gemmatimonadetes bacterium]|nr:NAD+ synthase [Gemmatimonadota bacterium]
MSTTLTVAVAQFAPVKGDIAANLDRIQGVFAQLDALEPRPQLLVFPETTTTGYFVEGGVRDLAMTAGALAEALDERYRQAVRGAHVIDVVVGFYERWRNTLYNSALVVRLGASPGGEVLHVHRKNFLPTYGMFDEERFVERGHDIRAFDAGWGRAAVLVCEDAWHSLSGTVAALDGAQVVMVIAAAPARGAWPRDDAIPGPATVARWERLVRDIAEEHGVFVVLANLVGSEGGKTFQGSSTIVGPRGDVRMRAPVFDDAVLTLTLDLADLDRARADTPMLADLRTALPFLSKGLDEADGRDRLPVRWDEAPMASRATEGAPARGARKGAKPPADALPVVTLPFDEHGTPSSLSIDPAMVEGWLVRFLRMEFARRGFQNAVIGLSGGVDSAVTAFLCAKAFGAEHVHAIRMPYRTSSADSLAHAQLVIDALGIPARTIDISAAVDGYLAAEPDADAARRGNVMARTRMIVLFDQSAKLRALPVGTGNKTERLFGYFTWHADDSPPVNPVGDLYKTQVWALARHLGVPDAIVHKPASADLIKGQTDEGDFGISYAKADVILNWLLHGYEPAALVARGFDAGEIALVRKRLEGTHWKRRLPANAMVSPTAIGEAYLRPVDY